jgi:hypothetical protein
MKKVITLSVFICFSQLSFLTTIFVDYPNNAPTIYSNIQAAVDATSLNDTSYIEASDFHYQVENLV